MAWTRTRHKAPILVAITLLSFYCSYSLFRLQHTPGSGPILPLQTTNEHAVSSCSSSPTPVCTAFVDSPVIKKARKFTRLFNNGMHSIPSCYAGCWAADEVYNSLYVSDVHKKGYVQAPAAFQREAKGWSLEAWVRVETLMDQFYNSEFILLSYGPFHLTLHSPGVPTLAVQGTSSSFSQSFKYKQGYRAHCGDHGLLYIHSQSDAHAAELCTLIPGCNLWTRCRTTKSTWYCKGYYDVNDPDPDYSIGLVPSASRQQEFTHALGNNQWYHVAATYSATDSVARVFVNGVVISQQQVAPPRWSAQSHSFDIGGSSRMPLHRPFAGQIANARLWSRALSISEVQNSMYTPQFPTSNPDLLAHLDRSKTTGVPAFPEVLGWKRQALPTNPSSSKYRVAIVVMSSEYSTAIRPEFEAAARSTAGCPSCSLVFFWASFSSAIDASDMLSDPTRHVLTANTSTQHNSSGSPPWAQAVKNQLGMLPDVEYVVVLSDFVQPAPGWLTGLIVDAQGAMHKRLWLVQSKLVYTNGKIFSYGLKYQMEYMSSVHKELPMHTPLFQGYPATYRHSLVPLLIEAATCTSVMLSRDAAAAFRDVPGHLNSEWGCVDLSLRLQLKHASLITSPSSVIYVGDYVTPPAADERIPSVIPPGFYTEWSSFLHSMLNSRRQVNATATWVMHCGGSMGIEAANMLQGLEGLIPMRVQIQRGGRWCEHSDTLGGNPQSFQDRVYRMRHLSSLAPTDVMIYHKDYRNLAAWPWPPGKPSSYIIGRYMWEVGRIHEQWAEHIRTELDEVWVPSQWHASVLQSIGVDHDKVHVIPESLDTSLFDPDIWDAVPLPGRRGFAFLAIFKLEDRKGWRELLDAFLQEFANATDVSLYIHTTTHPGLSYRRDVILNEMSEGMQELGYQLNLFSSPPSAPHIHVFGKHLNTLEMLRIYKSVDAFVLPSHGEGWGLPYMEAMSMAKPVIATNWSGMTEFMHSDNSLLLDYTIEQIHTSDPWFQGATWAEPNVAHLRSLMRQVYSWPEAKRLALGLSARSSIVNQYDNVKVASVILDRLLQLSSKLHIQQPQKQLDLFMDGVDADVHLSFLAASRKEASGVAPVATKRADPSDPMKVVVVSSWPPRACGIATFAASMVSQLERVLPPGSVIKVVSILSDTRTPSDSSPATDKYVAMVVRQHNLGDYSKAVSFISSNGFQLVILQHEFGVWGGSWGSYATVFAGQLSVPVIAIVHTLSDNLVDTCHYNLFHLAGVVDKVVVMSETSKNQLTAFHGIPESKVAVIPHGVPAVEQWRPPDEFKHLYGWSNRTVIMTNGLLHPGKGVDLVIRALPRLTADFPDILYVVLGIIHPSCGKVCEDHQKLLKQQVRLLGLHAHVAFMDDFPDDASLLHMVQAVDIFILPYRDRITTNSGTLSMAMAAGKVVVATPFEHARSALPGHGALIAFENESSIVDRLGFLLRNPGIMSKLSKAAFEYAKDYAWHAVAKKYKELFDTLLLAAK